MMLRKLSIPTVLLIGVALALVSFVVTRNQENNAIQEALEHESDDYISALRWVLENTTVELESLGVFFNVFSNVNRQKFSDFVTPFLKDNSVIQAFEWVPYVPYATQDEFERSAQQEGFINFQIKELDSQGQLVKAHPRTEYFPILYIEPFSTNREVLGFDQGGENIRRNAVMRAYESGKISATATINLMQNTNNNKNNSILLFNPVYQKNTALQIVRKPLDHVLGFAAVAINVGNLIEEALSYRKSKGIDLAIYDITDSQEQLLHKHRSRRHHENEKNTSPDVFNTDAEFQYASTLNIGGRMWDVRCFSTNHFIDERRGWTPWGLALGILLCSAIFTVHLHASQKSAEHFKESNDRLTHEMMERKAVEERLLDASLHDAMTQLPNRKLLMDRLDLSILRAKRNADYLFAVLFLDLDNFKTVNDSLGHYAGDRLIIEMAERLTSCLRSLDKLTQITESTASRQGGDEFVILLDGIHARSDAILVAERILNTISEPFDINNKELIITASIGIAIGSEKYNKADDLLRDADIAMYRAKSLGRGQYSLFTQTMRTEVIERLKLEHDLRIAVTQSQFRLDYQPIVEMSTGEIASFEALIRWDHPERGLVNPDDFIFVAEMMGNIVDIGYWVIAEACQQISIWQQSLQRDLAISVNVTKRQLLEPDFVDHMQQIMRKWKTKPNQLIIETTESIVVAAENTVNDTLDQLKRIGISLHMDDFGTGYSSLSSLKNLPFDVIKIDRGFIINFGKEKEYISILHAVSTLAHNLNKKIVVEGIENDEQLAAVLTLDIDYGQGYYFAKPGSADQALQLMQSESPWHSYL